MTASAWTPPDPAPVRARYDRENDVLWLPDAAGLTVSPVAPPLAGEELVPWARPSAAASFPFHPAGVVELQARAAARLVSALDELGVTGEDRRRTQHQCWRATCQLYAPGRPLRAALDEFVEQRKYQPTLTGEDADTRLAAQRTGLLAAWAVTQAALAWAGEAK